MASAPAPDLSSDERLLRYIRGAPKAELHVHVEGTLQPELMFKLAAKNGLTIDGTVESHRIRREKLKDQHEFLDLCYSSCDVLHTEEDFRDLMYAYLKRASMDNVYATEIYFSPQIHTKRGIPFDVVILGLYRGVLEGHRDLEIRASLIMCFLRHLPEESALTMLEQARSHCDKIVGVGLSGVEVGNPPGIFELVFKKAAEMGLKLVANVGEEAGPDYIRESLETLNVCRIDHGMQCLENSTILEKLAKQEIPLITCPLSNIKLQVNSRYFGGKNITGRLLKAGLKVIINSDSPAYFGGYINENFIRAVADCKLKEWDIYTLCRNSFTSSFLSNIDKAFCISHLDHHTIASGYAAPSRSISIFCSNSPEPGSSECEEVRTIARLMASKGFTILTRGHRAGVQGPTEGQQEISGVENQDQQICSILFPGILAHQDVLENHSLTQPIVTRSVTNQHNCFCKNSEYFLVSGWDINTIVEFLFLCKYAEVRHMAGVTIPKIFVLHSKFEKLLGVAETMNISLPNYQLIQCVNGVEEVMQLVEEDLKQHTATATIMLPPLFSS